MPGTYRIREYESFTTNPKLNMAGYHTLPKKTFEALENLLLENRNVSEGEADASELLSIRIWHGEKLISAKNYVGLITLKDGTSIEILPKIDGQNVDMSADILIRMLRTVKDIPLKTFSKANVKTDRIPLFEVFLRMFLTETENLVKKGIKSGYVEKSENLSVWKGKMDFSAQIKTNLGHKERFYVSHDDFEQNRPENKLIKSTLQYVQKYSHSNDNKRLCKTLLGVFMNISESTNYVADFAKCENGRNMREYEQILKWSKVFLMNQSFTPLKGNEVAFALLFPMEQLYEAYVASELTRYVKDNRFQISIQDKRFYLFDMPKKFALRPDIVLRDSYHNCTFVMDTKWKRLSIQQQNYGISQSDMYQMYAYQKKYHAKKVVLLYPYHSGIPVKNEILSYSANEEESVHIDCLFMDLADMQGSIGRLINHISSNE